ncbi:MAG: nitroreductase family protein [Thermoplasmata archaeon]|nr:nitroreductase family protein [Thermoplasmata archaeon]
MEVKTAIRERRSIRAFKTDPVAEEVVIELIELANMAPSAGNLQAREFIAVRDDKTKEALAAAALNQMFISEAPVCIVVCVNYERIAHYGERGRELYVFHDTGAAIQNILLAVHDMGLGAVWVGAFDEDPVKRILNLPEHIRPVAIVPVGHPVEQPKMRVRRDPSDILRKESW